MILVLLLAFLPFSANAQIKPVVNTVTPRTFETVPPTAPLRSLLYDVKVQRPTLSPNITTARNQATSYCKDFIKEYESLFLKENKIEDRKESPFSNFCKVATEIINRTNTIADLNFTISRIDDRANQTAFFFQSKRLNSFVSKYLESESANKNLLETVEKSKTDIVDLKAQLKDLGSKDEKSGSLFSMLGLKDKLAHLIESILVLLNLGLALFLLKKTL